MRYLGLDLGLKCGHAAVAPGRDLDVGTWRLKGRKENVGHVLLRFQRRLDEERPQVIGYEKIDFAKTTYSAHMYGALKAKLFEWAAVHAVDVHGFAPGTIKKRATGKGNASKVAVQRAAERVLGRTLPSDDASDAFWCLVLLTEKLR